MKSENTKDGICASYRKQIVEMVEKIENQDYLFKIFHYTLAKYRRERNDKETED